MRPSLLHYQRLSGRISLFTAGYFQFYHTSLGKAVRPELLKRTNKFPAPANFLPLLSYINISHMIRSSELIMKTDESRTTLYLPSAREYIPPTTMMAMAISLAAVKTFCTLVARVTLKQLMKVIIPGDGERKGGS